MEGSLVGKLLIAMPGIGDPRFERAVVLMCLHTPEAAMGLIVNHVKEDMTLGDVLEHLGVSAPDDIAQRPVLQGGPVKPDRGWVLHSPDFDAGEATQAVSADVNMTATRDVLETLGQGSGAPEQFTLALGYAGWGPGQLEQELLQNSWLVGDVENSIVFGGDHASKWTRAIRRIGIDPSMLTGQGGNA